VLNTLVRARALDSFQLSRRAVYICMATFSWHPYR